MTDDGRQRVSYDIEAIETFARECLNTSDFNKLRFYVFNALGHVAQALQVLSEEIGTIQHKDDEVKK